MNGAIENAYCEHCDDEVSEVIDGFCGDCAIGWELGECVQCNRGAWVNVWGECSDCESETHSVLSGGQ